MASSSRVKKSLKNVAYGLVTQALTVALNFVARVKFVKVLGGDANGMNGLFLEIVAMLSLAELGVGTAITYSLYKPLAVGDNKKVSQIMWLFKTAYRIIAVVIFIAGLICTPFIHLVVKETDFSLTYIRTIFLLFVLRTVSTYLMSYKTSLLIADQRTYVVSAVNAVSKILCTLCCILSLIWLGSFEAYLIVIILFNLFTNLCVTIYSKRLYPFINKKDRLDKSECKEILSNIKHIFISKVSGKITNSTDNILISVLVNTFSTGVYSNYSLIITNVKLVFEQIMNSITGSFGNLMATESAQHCERTLKNITFIFFSMGVVLGGGLYSASRPFMVLFFGEEFTLDFLTLFVCSLNLFIAVWILPLWHMMSVSGLFKHDKWISVTGSGINLVVSLVLGWKIGMAGIFIGTSCTYIVQMVLKIFLLYKRKFNLPVAKYFVQIAVMFLVAVIAILLEGRVCSLLNTGSLMLSFIISGVVSFVMSTIIVLLIYCRSSEMKYFINLVSKRFSKRSEN